MYFSPPARYQSITTHETCHSPDLAVVRVARIGEIAEIV